MNKNKSEKVEVSTREKIRGEKSTDVKEEDAPIFYNNQRRSGRIIGSVAHQGDRSSASQVVLQSHQSLVRKVEKVTDG